MATRHNTRNGDSPYRKCREPTQPEVHLAVRTTRAPRPIEGSSSRSQAKLESSTIAVA